MMTTAADRSRVKQGGHHFTDEIVALFPHVAGDQNLAGVGEAHGDEGDEHHHLAAHGDRGKTAGAHHLPNHDHIHHVVDHLQQPGQEKGHGKAEERSRNAACGQIPDQFPVFLCHVAPRKSTDKKVRAYCKARTIFCQPRGTGFTRPCRRCSRR